MFFDHRTVNQNAVCPKCGISAKELNSGKVCNQEALCLSMFIRGQYHSLSKQYGIIMRALTTRNVSEKISKYG